MHTTWWLALIVVINLYSLEAYKILVIFPLPSRSHSILGDGVVRNLLEAGHEVTYITANPWKNPARNLRQIDASSIKNSLLGNSLNVKALMYKQLDFTDRMEFSKLLADLTNATFSNYNVQRLLYDTKEKFDVMVAEWFFGEILSGFSAVFECPYIWVSTMEPHWEITRLIDEPLNPSYNPDILSSNIIPFGYYQRIMELITQLKTTTLRTVYFNAIEQKAYKRIFGPPMAKRGKKLPLYNELIYNASLILGNSHVSLGEATPLPQSYKPVGGYHIDDKLTPLPEKLAKILNTSRHGVIYFSMGSNLNSKDMPEELKAGLLEMFGNLDYTVIWKFEEALPNKPENVHIIQWAPQTSILAHPNCLLFITHGGLLSTTETIHFGKPIIGVPAFGDQFINVKRMVKKGFALKVDLTFSLPKELEAAIEEILSNSSYARRAKQLSEIYHDRPVPPGKELVHWVEHVVRTGGAPHLRSPALHLPFYQKLYLDLVALIVVIFYVISKIMSFLCKLIFKSKKAKKQKTE